MTNAFAPSGAAAQLAGMGVAYAPAIAAAAARHGLDPRLLAAVAAQETGGPGSNAGRNVVGDGGHGRGVFQIDDRWHAFARTAAAMDPGRNADYAAGMLAGLVQRYGSVRRALCAYNAGNPLAAGTRTTWPDGARLAYADSVLRHYTLLGAHAPELQNELAAERGADPHGIAAWRGIALGRPLPLPAAHACRPDSEPAELGQIIAGTDG